MYAKDDEKLQKLTGEVFNRLRNAGIHLQASNCSVRMDKIDSWGLWLVVMGFIHKTVKLK